jgi:4'-phosphopantetheinyl transferase
MMSRGHVTSIYTLHRHSTVNSSPASPWAPTRSVGTLTPDEVHIWKVELSGGAFDVRTCFRMLDREECAKANAFHFERDRIRYVTTHGALRILLGEYLSADPAAVRFQHNPYGKPALATALAGLDLRFNLSHSESIALIAIRLGGEVGVDVERIRPEMAGEEIAVHFFAPGEVAALRQVAPDKRQQAFFACWTRKEAYIKVRGRGLSLPLDSFEVSVVPETAAVLWAADVPDATTRWHMRSLDAGDGYAAALATEGAPGNLICRAWRP